MSRRRPTEQLEAARAALRASDALGDREPGAKPDQIGDDATGQFWLMTDPSIRFAIEVALATGRPILVEGEPGTGKSTLALAVAKTLRWRYIEVTVTSRTQAQDLLWDFDHLERLRDAHLGGKAAERVDDPRNYVKPSVFWKAFYPRAEDGSGPAVVLVDEIDKADPEVPDNLLVPLGSLRFDVGHGFAPVVAKEDHIPLVIITSNRERQLSPPFLRRCVKLYLETPTPHTIAQIARGHLGHDDRSAEAVAAAFEVLLGADDPMKPASLSTAAFIDAARAARELGLSRNDVAWSELRKVLEGRDDGLVR